LFWAFFYNAICMPVAAGVFVFLTGWALNPMLGAAAMSLSSFCVVTNALRLNLAKIHGAPRRVKIKNKENENMKKTMFIEGMMCAHCEARVKKALEKIEGVEEAVVSHEKGTAEITLSSPVSNEILKAAVEEQDYIVKDIKTA
ncbi:MAG: metal-transporting ATPase, partial [Clostridia bacterium]|nr:metal-transporting ATPase [Clostridia bacterium]